MANYLEGGGRGGGADRDERKKGDEREGENRNGGKEREEKGERT